MHFNHKLLAAILAMAACATASAADWELCSPEREAYRAHGPSPSEGLLLVEAAYFNSERDMRKLESALAEARAASVEGTRNSSGKLRTAQDRSFYVHRVCVIEARIRELQAEPKGPVLQQVETPKSAALPGPATCLRQLDSIRDDARQRARDARTPLDRAGILAQYQAVPQKRMLEGVCGRYRETASSAAEAEALLTDYLRLSGGSAE